MPKPRSPLERPEVAVTGDAITAIRGRFPGSFVRKIGASTYGASGCADVYALLAPHGQEVWIEFKAVSAYATPTKGLEPHQIRFGQRTLEAGGWWGVACSVQQAVSIAERRFANDRSLCADMSELLNDAYEAAEFARSERAKRRKKKPEPTADQLLRRREHMRRTRRKYRLPADTFNMLRRPVLGDEGKEFEG